MKHRTLSQDLLLWCLGSLTLVWASFIAIGWATGHNEADELTDGHLAGTTTLLLTLGPAQFTAATKLPVAAARTDLKAHDYEQSLSVVVWDAAGNVLTRSGQSPVPEFDAGEGFATLTLGRPQREWRVFGQWDAAHERKVMVLTSVQEREALADDIAFQSIVPGLWLLPVIAIVLAAAIRRGLRPLVHLSRAVGALEVGAPREMSVQLRHEEFKDMVHSINALASRFDAALVRERDIAGEFAHELRTPLASIALHAREARERPSEEARSAALERLEADALRAGEVLTQLLSLARASRARQSEAASEVDMADLAREVVAEFAPAAHETGHELAVARSAAFKVRGHPVLLQLALRNLLENAISHTPPGTLVEVRIDPVRRWLQVCDNGKPVAHAAQRPGPALGLGLGHRVVAKIAEVHGATFASVTAPQGFTSCYQFAFDASAPAG